MVNPVPTQNPIPPPKPVPTQNPVPPKPADNKDSVTSDKIFTILCIVVLIIVIFLIGLDIWKNGDEAFTFKMLGAAFR